MNYLQRLTALILILGTTALAFAETPAKPPEPSAVPATASNTPEREINQDRISQARLNQAWMIEGEKRYRVNCGRCHQPPHKFAPRAMAMAVRQMRVRAMLTEDDMNYVLYYVTH